MLFASDPFYGSCYSFSGYKFFVKFNEFIYALVLEVEINVYPYVEE